MSERSSRSSTRSKNARGKPNGERARHEPEAQLGELEFSDWYEAPMFEPTSEERMEARASGGSAPGRLLARMVLAAGAKRDSYRDSRQNRSDDVQENDAAAEAMEKDPIETRAATLTEREAEMTVTSQPTAPTENVDPEDESAPSDEDEYTEDEYTEDEADDLEEDDAWDEDETDEEAVWDEADDEAAWDEDDEEAAWDEAEEDDDEVDLEDDLIAESEELDVEEDEEDSEGVVGTTGLVEPPSEDALEPEVAVTEPGSPEPLLIPELADRASWRQRASSLLDRWAEKEVSVAAKLDDALIPTWGAHRKKPAHRRRRFR